MNERRILMKAFKNAYEASSLIDLWCGCFTVETLKTDSMKYMKEL